MAHAPLSVDDLAALQSELRSDLLRVALRDRWERPLLAIGWLHLLAFAVHQGAAMALNASWPHLILWPAEVAADVMLLRLMLGPSWWRSTPLAGVLARVWITFLILSFNAVTLNAMTGLGLRWYFLVWAGLASFGFATTAWLCGVGFLIPAFVMYFSSLAMVRWIEWSFLLQGITWWLVLQGIALWLVRRRLRSDSGADDFAFDG
ncbi:hypothetical protein [Tautonia sociabilis]|uniref:Uncharacterized protein n=1 Tax=Tautonia sociabilis TaxID=2080755 RepID=A0A432MNF4_9BACT|nr:hypothetical protein [Tautonia sociabilis]RUL88840.1 hypothetical protein TsocGM_05660 [Tautonia sociabilis]